MSLSEPCDADEADPAGADVAGADVAAAVGVDAVAAADPGAPDLAADEPQALTAPNDATRMLVATDVLMFMVPLLDGQAFDHNDVRHGWRLSVAVGSSRMITQPDSSPPDHHPRETININAGTSPNPHGQPSSLPTFRRCPFS
jgi:hypothetical protein